MKQFAESKKFEKTATANKAMFEQVNYKFSDHNL